MFKITVILFTLLWCSAEATGRGYGSSGSKGGGRGYGGQPNDVGEGRYGVPSGTGRRGGYSGPYSGGGGGYRGSKRFEGLYGFGRGGGYGGGRRRYGQKLRAAIQTRHRVEYVDVNLPQDDIELQIIEVKARQVPLVIHFKSASSRIHVHQSHEGAAVYEVQKTQSADEPHRLIHEVTKPIIQEVREVITPFRRVIQEIRPVQEDIQTIVARRPDNEVSDQGNQNHGQIPVSDNGLGLGGGGKNDEGSKASTS